MLTADTLIEDNVALIDDRTRRLFLVTELTSQVSQESLLRQTVSNTSQSIELLREAVSNSVDANCENISIQLENAGGDMWNIVIEDDGDGMEERHMRAFFNAGESVKDVQRPAIGEKGLGSKTCFVAKEVLVESRWHENRKVLLVGRMKDPLQSLSKGQMPSYTIERALDDDTGNLTSKGTRIALSNVHITRFNGKETKDPKEIAERVFHYLRSMCATGTVKNRHDTQQHILNSVASVGVIPQLTLEVVGASSHSLGPQPGCFQIPLSNTTPTGGPLVNGIAKNSSEFCDVHDFARSRTFSVNGQNTTVHYDGTAIIAGENVRADMLKHELKQGWTQKSQMGVHLCKDFIPLKVNNSISRDLLDGEYYYEFKVFLNCQNFQVNADRNVLTNEDSDEISWIWDDFKTNVWPEIEEKAKSYNEMKDAEDSAIKAKEKAARAKELKDSYPTLTDVAVTKSEANLQFVKKPLRESDVSHLLAMMVQSGAWTDQLSPISKFGQYIDASTDVIVENSNRQALLLEIETKLANLFKHRHPLDSFNLVVVWTLDQFEENDTASAPWGANGTNVTVTLRKDKDDRWQLKWGGHERTVIVLEEIL